MDPLNTQNSPLGEGKKPVYTWVIGVIVLIVLVFAGYRMYSKKNISSTNVNGYSQEEVAKNLAEATGDLEVENQLPGDIAYISSVTLSRSGFVSISSMGKAIGSKAFPEGKNPGQIVLSEKTKEGKTYTASLYADDGDGVLDTSKDRLLVEKTFRATQYLEYIKG